MTFSTVLIWSDSGWYFFSLSKMSNNLVVSFEVLSSSIPAHNFSGESLYPSSSVFITFKLSFKSQMESCRTFIFSVSCFTCFSMFLSLHDGSRIKNPINNNAYFFILFYYLDFYISIFHSTALCFRAFPSVPLHG